MKVIEQSHAIALRNMPAFNEVLDMLEQEFIEEVLNVPSDESRREGVTKALTIRWIRDKIKQAAADKTPPAGIV